LFRGARFTDAGELQKLRALRTASNAGSSGAVTVNEGTETYALYMRDELPADVASSVETLIGH
jgi:hypothetical protein